MNKDYFKYGLFAACGILVLIIFWQVYRAILKAKNDINAQADAIHDSKQDTELSKTYGVDKNVLQKCRNIAYGIAYELETLKDNKSIPWTHFTIDSRLKDIWKPVSSDTEAKIISNLYKNQYTYGRNIYNDLKSNYTSAITGINYFKISDYPYIAGIINY